MKWWRARKDTRLIAARKEQDEIKRKGKRREELARRAETHIRNDPFGRAFRSALGGKS